MQGRCGLFELRFKGPHHIVKLAAMADAAVNQSRVSELKKMLHAFSSDHLPSTISELTAAHFDQGGSGSQLASSFSKAVESLIGEGAEADQLGERAELVRSQCWEKLSAGGGWPCVGWRESYVDSLMMLALDKCASAGDVNALTQAMQYLDMALIMGGPPDAVHQIVDAVEPVLKTYPKPVSASPSTEALSSDRYTVSDKVPESAPPIDSTREISRVGRISFAEFKKDWFKTDTPVVLTGVIDDWPGMKKWSDLRYIRSEYGHRTVPLEVGKLEGGRRKEGWREETMPIKDLVDKYLVPSNERCRAGLDSTGEEVAYLAQHGLFDQIPALQGDLEVPEYSGCGSLEGVNAWLGTAGTVTPLHFDTYDNLLTQAVGFKYVRLYDRKQTPFLYVAKASGAAMDVTAQGNVSPVECETPDHEKHPLFRDAVYTETILAPGDMLYIPSKHWHYVRSLTPSFSVNFWF